MNAIQGRAGRENQGGKAEGSRRCYNLCHGDQVVFVTFGLGLTQLRLTGSSLFLSSLTLIPTALVEMAGTLLTGCLGTDYPLFPIPETLSNQGWEITYSL